MAILPLTVVSCLTLSALARAQSSSFSSLSITATNVVITVSSPPTSAAVATYFPYESLQLDPSAIAAANVSLFTFDNSTSLPSNTSVASKKRSLGECKTFPGDILYPSSLIWDLFDLFVGGRLIQTVPLAAPCFNFGPYGWDYNAAECSTISADWNSSYLHMDDPTSIMQPFFEGRTCMPTGGIDGVPDGNCTIGGYPSYVVNVSTVADIQLGINFARNANLRLVVKNTGHDFLGKSAGAGALSLWTHHLKDFQFYPSVTTSNYSGPAIKMGAGVQAFEIYQWAQEYGVTVVGGEGKTVGIAGGYVQGGGHSPLSSIYGMAADNVLSYEVVTADGVFRTASLDENPDLFWALRGGGGSAFGVTTSVTVKAHPDMQVTVVTFEFSNTGNVTTDIFWEGVRAYFDYFIPYTEAGTYSYFDLIAVGGGTYLFAMAPFFGAQLDVAQTEALLAPWFNRLAAMGIVITPVYSYYTNFYEAWNNSFPLETVGYDNIQQGSRLFPRSNWENETLLNSTFDVIKTMVEEGNNVLSFNIAPTEANGGYQDNSVNPAWRNTVMHAIAGASWNASLPTSEIQVIRNNFTYVQMQPWRDVSPGAGCYMSEADVNEPNFQQAFYGSKYAELYSLKQKWDPYDVFYAITAVGSENWQVITPDGTPSQNGPLCRVQ